MDQTGAHHAVAASTGAGSVAPKRRHAADRIRSPQASSRRCLVGGQIRGPQATSPRRGRPDPSPHAPASQGVAGSTPTRARAAGGGRIRDPCSHAVAARGCNRIHVCAAATAEADERRVAGERRAHERTGARGGAAGGQAVAGVRRRLMGCPREGVVACGWVATAGKRETREECRGFLLFGAKLGLGEVSWAYL